MNATYSLLESRIHMIDYSKAGNPACDDYTRDNNMTDLIEETIYQSKDNVEGSVHKITITVWSNDGETVHNYCYGTDDGQDFETQETATYPEVLVDELPEEIRAHAHQAIRIWRKVSGL